MLRDGAFGLSSSSRISLSRSFAYPEEEIGLAASTSFEAVLQPKTTKASQTFLNLLERQQLHPPATSSLFHEDSSLRESLLRNKISPIAKRTP